MESVTEDLATDDGLYWEKQQTSPLSPEVEITTDPTRDREPDDSKYIQLLTCIPFLANELEYFVHLQLWMVPSLRMWLI